MKNALMLSLPVTLDAAAATTAADGFPGSRDEVTRTVNGNPLEKQFSTSTGSLSSSCGRERTHATTGSRAIGADCAQPAEFDSRDPRRTLG